MAGNGEQNACQKWVNSIRGKIPRSSSKPFTPRPTIFRVPERIRRGNEDAYEPQVVSIGPYHRNTGIPERIRGGNEDAYESQVVSIGPYHQVVSIRPYHQNTGIPERIRGGNEDAYEPQVVSIGPQVVSQVVSIGPYHRNTGVPEPIRGGNEDAYQPQVVSIGLYHRDREKFVDEHKWRYVQAILQRNPNKSLADYFNKIKELEDRARSCYAETTEIRKIESNDFVEIMFVDGCFLVELFLKRLDEITGTRRQDDIIYSDQLLAGYLKRDLCLLENQLPYFILECIFEIVMSNQVYNSDLFADKFDNFLFFEKILPSDAANPSSVRSPLLASLAITFIPTGVGFKIRSSDVADGEKASFHHLLHLFRYSFSPHPDIHLKKTPAKSILQKLKIAFPSTFLHLRSYGSTSPATRKLLPLSIPTATMLQYAGVTFKKAKEPGNSLIIKFDGGAIEIPHLLISKSFNLVIRNFNAFEQCHQGILPKYFSIHSYFMDCLINTPKDVEILRQDGIIEHLLGSDEEVALLFNRIAEGAPVYSDERYLSDVFEEVTEYYNTRCHIWLADLRRKYCSSPLAFLSFVAATILLLLTVIQTIFSFLSYFRPPSSSSQPT